MSRPAAFLDRDGTIIEERHYLADPDGVVLLPGAAEGLRALRGLGFALVIITNQSGIARGLYDQAAYRAVQARTEALLRAHGVRIDGTFLCPHHPDFTGPCACRKPGVALFREAARTLDLDLGASIYVGDRVHDAAPAGTLGGRGFLVRTGHGVAPGETVPAGVEIVADLRELVYAVSG
jgi:D-glycero-D-manno-heptose 1,7-bisphosphate phosphatase